MADRLPAGWVTPPDLRTATAAQRAIADACETRDRLGVVEWVGGADTSCKWRDTRGPIHAAIVGQRLDGAAGEAAAATRLPPFPYVPGYLGFREVPSLLAAWEALVRKPDLLLVDGHGRAHPRRCGIATQLGVVLDAPTIGIAKTLLCGEVEGVLGDAPGDRAPLIHRDEQVGWALRTRARAAPVYVSVGHRISLESAVRWVMRLSDGRRLPPPIRGAHDAANAARRAWIAAEG